MDYSEPATFMKGTDFKQEHVQVLSLFADCLEFSGPQSNGWLLVPNDAEEWQGSEPLTPQLSREWYSILLRKYRDDCARTFDAKGLFYALKLVHDRGDFDSINMLLDFVPDQRSYTELLSGDFFGRPFEYFLRDCFLVHEALLERVPNLRVFGKETPTSRSLRFSAIFLEWRSTIQGLYPNINSLIDKELTERHAPSLSGWDHDTLGALWALDFKEWPHFEVSYAADETACSYCGARGLMCDIEDTRCMLEPWWEELKHHVRTRSCLCSKREWLQNDHEPENHDHGLYEDMLDEFDDNDKQGGQGNTPSLGETSTLTDGTIDDSPGDSPDETGSFARVVSRHSADGASPSIQSEGSTGYCSDSSCETDSDLPFELVLRAYYAIYGPWKGEYNPGQCFCFRCFAKLEGWDIEFPPDETSSERSDESEADDTSSQSSDYDDDQEGESDVSDDSDEGDEVDTGNDCNALEAQKEAEAKEEHVDPMGVD
ncbi:hypothetical protein BJY00DRAFT_174794 [Aspergillus carlsbadensis]|nr:hypothetical protein BJY00DRAFT_174794 [Aspergillus carlsbadensis]